LRSLLAIVLCLSAPTLAQAAEAETVAKSRITGVVRDEQNSIPLPGVPVEVIVLNEITYTDVDGRYVLEVPPGSYDLKITMEGYQERIVRVDTRGRRIVDADVALLMNRLTETVVVTGTSQEADTSTAEAQISQRRSAPVITDNLGAREMRENGDTDAAAAMQRVTGLSVVDSQYVFVRGLGERYSNTTLAGSTIPTTEPDKKVVPLDFFPAALIDSVQVSKTYSPDKSADFAGGLVQIVPLKLPNRPALDVSYGAEWNEFSTGDTILLSPLGNRDWLGYDDGARTLPAGFPDGKVVRSGIYTPDVGFSREQITAFGRLLENAWVPRAKRGRPGQNWSVAFGDRWGRLGVLASARHSYKETYTEENRRFYRLGEGGDLEPVTDYDFQTGVQKAQLGFVANAAWQFNSNHRVSFDNFYTHSGRDEGRYFEGPNTENNFIYRNSRVQFIEEGLLTNAVSGDHYLEGWGNSRLDWRLSVGQADRDEPDLRETLYQGPLSGAGPYVLADESQSGFRLFSDLQDETVDFHASWSILGNAGGRPLIVKFGPSYVYRTRDFTSRRFRYIPTNAPGGPSLTSAPEQIYASANIGPYFRFNEETRPVDAYDAELETFAGYGMVDYLLSSRARVIAGARVESFREQVDTFDPFGLFAQTVTAELDNTDVFPGLNFVYQLRENMNVRLGASQTANRPEFRELAAFEFTDVVGNRATRGNPNLTRALIQNYDARWELFTGGRGLFAASVFFKNFDDPIERVISAGAQPLVTFENADTARNTGVELEASQAIGPNLFFSVNYTYVDSEITLTEAARQVQTSLTRPLAGQSPHLFNAIGEWTFRGFQTRVLYNFFDDRISDVGANGAPDIVESGRGTLDAVFIQRLGRLSARVTAENLTDPTYRFTQGSEDQRTLKLGRLLTFSLSYSFY
jgi:outer membrane receptor protein involved in Fe transport